MSDIKTGGPAFPEKKRVHRAGYETDEFEPCSGMTLRDYFAGKAMQGICTHQDTWGMAVEEIVLQSYAIADAMLAARSKA